MIWQTPDTPCMMLKHDASITSTDQHGKEPVCTCTACSQLRDQGTAAAQRGMCSLCGLLCGQLTVQPERPSFQGRGQAVAAAFLTVSEPLIAERRYLQIQ
jgi:hypothetical protein